MKSVFTKIALLQSVIMLAAASLEAQTYTNYHNFAAIKQNLVTYTQTNKDGGNAYATMVISGHTLYGTTAGGGTNGLGTVFKINTDGTGFTNVFTFTFVKDQPTNGDNGSGPLGGLALSGNTLYGTTREGGLRTNYYGSIFALQTDGTGFTNLHYFSTVISNKNSEGDFPIASLTLVGNRLFGVAYSGGIYTNGTIFAINTNGMGFTNLYNFDFTNGANPDAPLCFAGNMLYGTTYLGGAYSNGVIFAINTNGTGFTNYHSFSALGYPYPANVDGANSQSPLVASGNVLYGAAPRGGGIGDGYGALFSIHTDGSDFSPVYYFDYYHGAGPLCQLLLTNNLLYGTTSEGGSNAAGTVFSFNLASSVYSDLYNFPTGSYSGSAYTNSTGFEPWAGVVMSGNTLFGVTPTGGPGGSGTIYALILSGSAPVPLKTQINGNALVLSWSDASYTLQAAGSLSVSSFTNVPNATSPYTNTTMATQQFFRLKAN